MRQLEDYFDDVITILGDNVGASRIAHHTVLQRAHQIGGLRCVLHYPDESKLDINLWANCLDEEIEWTQHSFHYRDHADRDVFRFDDAPDHRKLANFPHHLHLPDGAIVGAFRPRLRLIAALLRAFLAGDNPFSDSDWRERFNLMPH